MKKVLAIAWPIMLSYVPLGLSCGFLASRCGIDPLVGLLMSCTLVTGSGQFMISNLWLAGLPALSIVASVAAVSLRFALYSASLAPHLKHAGKRMSLALAFTLVEEGYGVTLAKLTDGDRDWTLRRALALNVVTISAWALSVSAGCALGGLVDIPTAVASFTMTALFIYLLWTQLDGRDNVVAAVSSAVVVVACKLIGLANVAVPVAAVVGLAVALLACAEPGRAGGACSRADPEPGRQGEGEAA